MAFLEKMGRQSSQEDQEQMFNKLRISIQDQAFRGPHAKTFAENAIKLGAAHAYYYDEARQLLKVTFSAGKFVHEVQSI